MNDLPAVYHQYLAAWRKYGDTCAKAPELWHLPDVATFIELKRSLLPHAEAGNMLCQYALATILLQGLCCESEERAIADMEPARVEATPWLIAAAKQGYYPALDNLITCGVGPEAQRAKKIWRELENEQPKLMHLHENMPVYGPEFMEEVALRIYGRVIKESI